MFTHGNRVEFTKHSCNYALVYFRGSISGGSVAPSRNNAMGESPDQISELLLEWRNGDESSIERLVPLVESELKRIARNYLRREHANHSFQTSDLINEAYIRLVNQRHVQWQNRSHFFAVSSIILRRILLNHARDRAAGKRGGAAIVLNIDEVEILSTEKTAELISLDEALTRLADFDRLKARIVEMRYFGGLTAAETAEVLKITPAAVNRHWTLARAWLARQLRNC